MTSLRRSGGSGEGGGGSSGSDGGRTRSRCGAVRWGVSGGGQMQLQRRPRESLPPQQLSEWYASRSGGGGSSGSRRAGVQLGVSGGGLTQLQWRPRETLTPQQLPEWYVQRGASRSSARCSYIIRTGASKYALPGTAPAEALHTFTLDSGASRCLFRDSTTLNPLPALVPVRLADPSGGLVVARSSTVLPCPAVPSGSRSGLHIPSFSTNLASTAALHDSMVTITTLGGQRVLICTCTRTGRHLVTFTCRPGSSLYTLATEPPQVAASAQMSASGQVAPPCSCCLLSHQTLLWHHCLGHPSLPHLRGMHSRLLVSALPRSLPPLPPSPAPPCLPCVEGRQRAAPHSSSFPPTTAPLQTLYMHVWGPGRVNGQGRERYFLLVVDDYTRYTMVFSLRSKGEFYHPTSCHVIPSQDVTLYESVPFNRLFPYRSAPPPPPPLFLAPGPRPVDPLPPLGLAPLGVSQVDPFPGTVPVEVAGDSGAARGAESGVAEPGGAESKGAGSGGAEHGGAEPRGVEPAGVEPGGAEPEGVEPEGAKN
ncbi:unnamed protein product [Closterium sp. NIES-53]